MRPDRSVRTFWREQPDDAALKEPSLEAMLPEAAMLTSIAPDLLAPNVLPGLWDTPEIMVQHSVTYFSRSHVVTIPRESYEEAMAIPRAEAGVVEQVIRTTVKEGTSRPRSLPWML